MAARCMTQGAPAATGAVAAAVPPDVGFFKNAAGANINFGV